MAKQDEEKVQDTLDVPVTFSEPLNPEGSGRVTLVTRFPYGEFKSKDKKTVVKSTGTQMSRSDADRLLAEAPAVLREIKKED